MRWPRRGILIRLAIYVPLIGLLAWRAQGGCNEPERMQKEDGLEQKLAPYRKMITLPDGTQQEIVELTAEEAEAILGHPIPPSFAELEEAEAEAKARAEAKAAAAASDTKAVDAKAESKPEATPDTKPETKLETKPSDAKRSTSTDARPADVPPAP